MHISRDILEIAHDNPTSCPPSVDCQAQGSDFTIARLYLIRGTCMMNDYNDCKELLSHCLNASNAIYMRDCYRQMRLITHWLLCYCRVHLPKTIMLYVEHIPKICTKFMCGHGYMQTDFTHILQDCFTGTGAIIWLPQCQWSNPEEYELTDHIILLTADYVTIDHNRAQWNHLHI